MEYLAFGDESGTTGKDKTYSIGLLCLPKAKLPRFNDYVDQLKKKRGIVGEMKWSKIKNSAGQVNICLDLLNMVLRSSCCFHSIIVLITIETQLASTGVVALEPFDSRF